MMQKRMALPLMVAMALFLGSWATPGSAQTLDELKAQIREMSKRLQELEVKQERLEKKADEVGVDTRNVISGKQGVKLTVSGQVNRGLLYVDNGDQDDLFHVDNDNSSTRVRFVGVGALTEDITLGAQIEVQFESNSATAMPAGPCTGARWRRLPTGHRSRPLAGARVPPRYSKHKGRLVAPGEPARSKQPNRARPGSR